MSSTGTPSARIRSARIASAAAPSCVVATNRYPTWRKNGGPSSSKKRIDSRASATSAAVSNCCRTPPIAFDVDPDATSPRSHRTTSFAPASARW